MTTAAPRGRIADVVLRAPRSCTRNVLSSMVLAAVVKWQWRVIAHTVDSMVEYKRCNVSLVATLVR
jgi:hypothetical protein